MTEEIGKIEKPAAEDFKKGRKLFFIPLLFSGGKDVPLDYIEILNRYWSQVEEQLTSLEKKLGKVNRVYHELLTRGGAEGAQDVQQLNEDSYQVIQHRIEKGAQLEALEDNEILMEFMDWGRCLGQSFQSQKVMTRVYQLYKEAGKKRDDHIVRRLNETLKEDESGILFMTEGHQVPWPADINIFYISPPALDEMKRWMRDYEARQQEKQEKQAQQEKQEQPEEKPAGGGGLEGFKFSP